MIFNDKNPLNLKKTGLTYLNITQFILVLNDNIFKLITAFFLIDIIGKESASKILSLVGAVYVFPFLLLSSFGGSLADRFSKRTITIIIKCMSGLIIACSFYIFFIKSVLGCYVLLFFLSTQSAIFGPSKYGIIPELVPYNDISKANGYVTSFTYLAIILGTFLGSFLSDVFHKNYLLVILVTFILSMIGIITSFMIPKTHRLADSIQPGIGSFRENFDIIFSYPKKQHFLLIMLASSFFLLIGGFTQLAIIPYAINSLKQSEFVGGYLFLATALGIAVGSQIVGRLSKNGPNLTYPAFAGVVLSVMMIYLGMFVSTLKGAIICLVILGIAGGAYVVPIDAYIQISALSHHRGRIIGTNNFLGFCGVFLASFLLYFFTDVINLKPHQSFTALGLIYSLFFLMFIAKLSDKLMAAWMRSKLLKKRPITIIPADINLLIVTKISFNELRKFQIQKDRVRLVTLKRHFFSPSCFIFKRSLSDIEQSLKQDIEPNELVIIEKTQVTFSLDDFQGKTGKLEAL